MIIAAARRTIAVGLAPVLAALAAPGAGAAEIDHKREYAKCMALVEVNSGEAFETALMWQDLGGGDAADHCAAVALMELGQHAEAARRFEAMAQGILAEPGLKADLLGQAAQAWLLAGKAGRARAVLGAALGLRPDDPGLLIDRATVFAAEGAYAEAVNDLDRAIGLDPKSADAFVFRASAQRFLDRLDAAGADLERALALDPEHAEGLLEHGIVRRLLGDDAGARKAWLRLLRTSPESEAALAARANLARMDVKQE